MIQHEWNAQKADNALRSRRQTRTVEERFLDFVSPEPNSGCWLWGGSCDRKGYGQLRLAQRGPGSLQYATHISLQIVGRPVPNGLSACHTCDNPGCVNPDHLFIGTHKENMADCVAKGRSSKPPIAVKGQGRLTDRCRKGHPLTADDIYQIPKGGQSCRQCRRDAKIAMRQRFKAAGLTSRGASFIIVKQKP